MITTAAALIALIGSIGGGIYVAESRYVRTQDFAQYAVEDFYDKFYAAEDRYNAAVARGDEKAASTAKRTMERLRAKICAIEPSWPRCDDT